MADVKIIEERMKKYSLKTKQDEKNALREIVQEITLSGLARTDFFTHACFVGGSCLRIIHGLHRFSEDLDFWTLAPSEQFSWETYLKIVQDECKAYSLHMEIEDRNVVNAKIKRAFLKQDSIGKMLIISHSRKYNSNEKLIIKLEIDTHPPKGAGIEIQNINFPYPYAISSLDKASLFASKIAALFDRNKEKGRHWYDFIWYIANRWPINYVQLGNSLVPPQQSLNYPLLQKELVGLVQSIKWDSLKNDIRPFITSEEQETINFWSQEYFLGHIEELGQYNQVAPASLADLIVEGHVKDLASKIKEAIDAGASVNDDSRNGHRPLQLALQRGYLDIASILIERGVDLNYRDRSGLTPLQTAVNLHHFDAAKFLIQSGARFNPHEPNIAFNQNALAEFKLLLSKNL